MTNLFDIIFQKNLRVNLYDFYQVLEKSDLVFLQKFQQR